MATPLSPEDGLLLERMMKALRDQGQFVRHMAAGDVEGITKVRSLGRRAGRDLGWKVRTFATAPDDRDDRMVVVIVAVTDSNPLHQQLLQVRGEKALRKAWKEWGL